MNKLILALAVALPFTAHADETCADFLGAIKTNNIENVWHSYMSGISDMGMVDEVVYRKRFLDASTSATSKQSKPWMFQRAVNKCKWSNVYTRLADVIKVTM